jgi:hypothetical protein
MKAYKIAGIIFLFIAAVLPLFSQTESILHSFAITEGSNPDAGLVFDKSGNLFGTLSQGGDRIIGSVYELQQTGTNWNLSITYGFCFNSAV